MAHFARIENGIVREILVISNEAIQNAPYPQSEALGQAVLAESGFVGDFKQCSYSGSFRGEYPAVGWRYDSDSDVFTLPT